MRRLQMAAATSAMVMVLYFVAYLLDLLEGRVLVTSVLLTVGFVLLFYTVFRTGLNLRFRDASLTLQQIVAATLVILYVLSHARTGHGVLSLVYLVAFLFGVFRLSTRQLLGLTAFVSVSYALILVAQGATEMSADPVGFNIKLLNWFVLTSVLAFFSVMGGYISRLRKNLSDSKDNLEEALLKIEKMAARDELTGVYNRRSLVDILKQQKYRVDRYGKPFSILIIDIDHFKRVNDTHGHHVGDLVLKGFANAAAASLRSTDVFGRYGGEEFMAIVEQTALEGSNVVAGRLCELARKLAFDDLASGISISVSIGGAEYQPREEWQDTVDRADKALYRAKQGGRDRFELAPAPPPEPNAAEDRQKRVDAKRDH